MARIRTVKPELAVHEDMFDLEAETGLPMRFAWVMLFTQCDREGRFQWRPRALKAAILPFDDVDFSRVLHAWVTRGFLVRYACGTREYGCIPTFRKHQVINNREKPSELPDPYGPDSTIIEPEQSLGDASTTREPRVPHAGKAEGKGREGKGEGLSEADKPVPCLGTKAGNVPYDAIRDLWLKHLPSLPTPNAVETWTDARKTRLRRLWHGKVPGPDLDEWEALFELVAGSDFLTGKANGRDWAATFDWVTQPKNIAKISEGTYK